MLNKFKNKTHPKRKILTYETLLREYSTKNFIKFILIAIGVCSVLAAILIFFTAKNASYNFTKEVITNIKETIIALAVILTILIIVALFIYLPAKNKLKKGICKILKCKVAYKKEFSDYSNSPSSDYFLYFICNEFGEFKISVTLKEYKAAQTWKTEYYLLVAPKSKGEKYKLLNSYSTKKWYCPDEANMVVVINKK